MVDLHSHLIPGVDDGVNNIEESLEILQQMSSIGFQKAITTPHIMHDFYPNTPEDIQTRLKVLQKKVDAVGIDMEIEAAAEYYLDEHFMHMLEEQKPLLTFGDQYLLFETSFLNEPAYLRECIFQILSSGHKPVLAHPERYVYVQNRPEILEDLMERGVLLQINTLSLSGHYSKEAKKLAELLIDEEMVSFVGSDCHHIKHLKALQEAVTSKHFAKVLDQPLLNNLL